MDACLICSHAIDGPRLTDASTGRHAHHACVAKALPQDVVVALLAALALVLVPTAVVWAG